jgi:hypothetical protein
MRVQEFDTRGVYILDAQALDAIQVFWTNYAPFQGSVTITCFGCAWTAYFGGMMSETIQQFFAQADTPYLISKLGRSQLLKARKKDDVYLARIISAIKEALRTAKETPKSS